MAVFMETGINVKFCFFLVQKGNPCMALYLLTYFASQSIGHLGFGWSEKSLQLSWNWKRKY